MVNLVVLSLFSIIVVILGELVHGRTLAQGQPLANMIRPNGTTRARILFQHKDDIPPPIPRTRKHCVAIVRTTDNHRFYGSRASLSVHKPKVQGRQWSSSRIKLSNENESIEAGWMVNPTLFGDDDAHLYARYTVGMSGCINTKCPGFVQVSKQVELGHQARSYSHIKGPKLLWRLSIIKNRCDGNWWLEMSWESMWHPIGYWPSSLFTHLKDAADQVQWGGEVSDTDLSEPAPFMGNGLKLTVDNREDVARFQRVTVADEARNFANPIDTVKYYDCPDLYMVWDAGYQRAPYGRLIYFSGAYYGNPW